MNEIVGLLKCTFLSPWVACSKGICSNFLWRVVNIFLGLHPPSACYVNIFQFILVEVKSSRRILSSSSLFLRSHKSKVFMGENCCNFSLRTTKELPSFFKASSPYKIALNYWFQLQSKHVLRNFCIVFEIDLTSEREISTFFLCNFLGYEIAYFLPPHSFFKRPQRTFQREDQKCIFKQAFYVTRLKSHDDRSLRRICKLIIACSERLWKTYLREHIKASNNCGSTPWNLFLVCCSMTKKLNNWIEETKIDGWENSLASMWLEDEPWELHHGMLTCCHSKALHHAMLFRPKLPQLHTGH